MPEEKSGGGTSTVRPRRRQARGERRIAQLLEAAARVFCTSGYTAASTSSIAREAGVSPGTLYQFFPNKEAIAIELGDHLLARWHTTYGEALTQAHLELPLAELLDAVLDPLIQFNFENPAFGVLMQCTDVPGKVTLEHENLHTSALARVEEILRGRLPDAEEADIKRIVRMTFSIFKGGLDLTLAAAPEERDTYSAELKTVLHRYLDPIIGSA
ncbi:TetR/AcrR family transcriptional regulator [Streptomyces corynorhini]|uniref:TetR/AcrR family transcriptional regulator n=1 Tax=Streptomyces corynorhini TaxID=2282652 RepID=A0A370B5A8_9ACTN|nr:TetR/AcrR family transcriptional regulator [Streptomyces corynorhini]RDG36761.1 TetR/AcrR family transcriptional regulator [Streptomyces corynorhini]